jgi:hypothetical protein
MIAVISFIQKSPVYYFLLVNAPEMRMYSWRYSSPFFGPKKISSPATEATTTSTIGGFRIRWSARRDI